MIPMT